jgi:predicted 3-demethylubiquinone-9 3-methyltransferase (glyoxalase superfamily)
MAMDGGPHFKFEQGTSLFVTCEDQEEVDYFWDKLGEGGQYMDCGWLKDQFGVSWQVVPAALGQLMSGPDPEKSQRVMQAMLKMQKIIIADLQQANDQA